MRKGKWFAGKGARQCASVCVRVCMCQELMLLQGAHRGGGREGKASKQERVTVSDYAAGVATHRPQCTSFPCAHMLLPVLLLGAALHEAHTNLQKHTHANSCAGMPLPCLQHHPHPPGLEQHTSNASAAHP